jgi:DNA-binding phage protein
MATDRDRIRDELRPRIAEVGWTAMARLSGVERASLHRAFRHNGKPNLDTINKVLPHVGLRLTLEPR